MSFFFSVQASGVILIFSPLKYFFWSPKVTAAGSLCGSLVVEPQGSEKVVKLVVRG